MHTSVDFVAYPGHCTLKLPVMSSIQVGKDTVFIFQSKFGLEINTKESVEVKIIES